MIARQEDVAGTAVYFFRLVLQAGTYRRQSIRAYGRREVTAIPVLHA